MSLPSGGFCIGPLAPLGTSGSPTQSVTAPVEPPSRLSPGVSPTHMQELPLTILFLPPILGGVLWHQPKHRPLLLEPPSGDTRAGT